MSECNGGWSEDKYEIRLEAFDMTDSAQCKRGLPSLFGPLV